MVEVEKIEPIRSWRKENKLTSIEFKARLKGKFIQWFNLLCPDYGLEDKIPINKKKILNPLMEIEWSKFFLNSEKHVWKWFFIIKTILNTLSFLNIPFQGSLKKPPRWFFTSGIAVKIAMCNCVYLFTH